MIQNFKIKLKLLKKLLQKKLNSSQQIIKNNNIKEETKVIAVKSITAMNKVYF